ncbi:MAG: CvpA family protein [Eubacteriales bacterium]
MFLDIFIAALMLASMIMGYRMGLLASLLKAIGWLVALVISVFLHPILVAVFKTKLGINSIIANHLKTMVDNGFEIESMQKLFPKLLQDGFLKLASSATDIWAMGIANLLVNIICLMLTVFLIKGIFALISAIVSNNDDENVIGFVNSLFGMIFGFIKGLLVVSILLCLLLPVTALAGEKVSAVFTDQLDRSIITKEFYNNNLTMVVFKNFSNDTK